MPTQVMIDIETLGKRTDACIIQVAAVAFNIQTGERSHTFNGLIRNSGGRLDVDTVAWWMQQAHAPVLGAKLQDASQSGGELPVLEALCSFFRLCGEVDQVWAHGGTGFDFPILQSAFERCGLAVPWHYRAPRDTRSLYDVAPGGMPRLPKDETREHDAQYDCEYQIAQVCAAWAALRKQARDVEYWKEEYRVTEEARAAFETSCNNLRAAKDGWKQRALDAGWSAAGGEFDPPPPGGAPGDALDVYNETRRNTGEPALPPLDFTALGTAG